MAESLRAISLEAGKELILIVDELEGLQNSQVLNAFLHVIRRIYHDRSIYRLRSVILTGVSNITGIIQDTASPFNIADQINVPYFRWEETEDLLLQHSRETGQIFEQEVIRAVHDNTAGQPGLVNALARDLVEKKAPNGETVTMEHFYKTLNDFMILYIDKNISNVVSKAKKHPEIMKKILFDGPVKYSIDDEGLSFLSVNGVIEKDKDDNCFIPVPIYKKRLYATFKPLDNGNGERNYFKDRLLSVKIYLGDDGYLDMERVLDRYAAYVLERGNIVFSRGKALEGVYHYNLDAFLDSFVSFFGGHVFPEVPQGGGRVDLLVLQGSKKWIIEVKRYDDRDNFDKGKRQLFEYMKRAGLNEGYYMVFSDIHKEQQKSSEQAECGVMTIWILPVSAPVPSVM